MLANKVSSSLINARNLKELIEKIGKEKYFWIIYTDFKGDETKRVISGLELIGEEQEKEPSKEVPPTYLKAHCHLRQANRLFKIDGIKVIKALNI